MKDQDYKNMVLSPSKYFEANKKKPEFSMGELTDVFIELVHSCSEKEVPAVEAFFHQYKDQLNHTKIFLNMVMLIRSNNTLFDSFLKEHRKAFSEIFLQTNYPLPILQKYFAYLDAELTEQEMNRRKEAIMEEIRELDDFIQDLRNRKSDV